MIFKTTNSFKTGSPLFVLCHHQISRFLDTVCYWFHNFEVGLLSESENFWKKEGNLGLGGPCECPLLPVAARMWAEFGPFIAQ
jgi:hypothetical protein